MKDSNYEKDSDKYYETLKISKDKSYWKKMMEEEQNVDYEDDWKERC